MIPDSFGWRSLPAAEKSLDASEMLQKNWQSFWNYSQRDFMAYTLLTMEHRARNHFGAHNSVHAVDDWIFISRPFGGLRRNEFRLAGGHVSADN